MTILFLVLAYVLVGLAVGTLFKCKVPKANPIDVLVAVLLWWLAIPIVVLVGFVVCLFNVVCWLADKTKELTQ